RDGAGDEIRGRGRGAEEALVADGDHRLAGETEHRRVILAAVAAGRIDGRAAPEETQRRALAAHREEAEIDRSRRQALVERALVSLEEAHGAGRAAAAAVAVFAGADLRLADH